MSEPTLEGAVHVCIDSDPEHMPTVRAAVRDVAARIGFDDSQIESLQLAADEAIANVIKHGYAGKCTEKIEVAVGEAVEEGVSAFCCVLRDFGKQTNPCEIRGRDLSDVRPGGLGVHIIQTVMDRVSYEPAEGGGMRVVMVKRKQP